jgi:hypothetical protein
MMQNTKKSNHHFTSHRLCSEVSLLPTFISEKAKTKMKKKEKKEKKDGYKLTALKLKSEKDNTWPSS